MNATRGGWQPGGLSSNAKPTTIYLPLREFEIQSDFPTARLSPLQKNLLDLASAGPVQHSAALQKIWQLSRIAGKRGALVFDYSDMRVKLARASLYRSIDRLVSRGLVAYVPHGYKLATGSNATTARRDP